jgi:hypothetical protein
MNSLPGLNRDAIVLIRRGCGCGCGVECYAACVLLIASAARLRKGVARFGGPACTRPRECVLREGDGAMCSTGDLSGE